MDDVPVEITVYDKDFAIQGTVGAPKFLKITPSHIGVGGGMLTVSDDDPNVEQLAEDGARIEVKYQGRVEMTGWIEENTGQLPAVEGSTSFAIVDDVVILEDVLGFPNPTLPAEQQGAGDTPDLDAYYVVTGPAETVVKDLVTKNAVARGWPVTVAPDLGRGETITVSIRMHPLGDKLWPAITQAGIGVTVRQVGTTLVLDCYENTTYPQSISEESGAIQGGNYSAFAPTVTRVIAGGAGEGTARIFRQTIDTAREASYGRRIEAFRDARDADNVPVLFERIAQSLKEGAPSGSLSLTLSETESFRYGGGTGVELGVRIPVEIRPGLIITETVTEVEIEYSESNYLRVTPILGERAKDTDTAFAASISDLFRGQRDMRTR